MNNIDTNLFNKVFKVLKSDERALSIHNLISGLKKSYGENAPQHIENLNPQKLSVILHHLSKYHLNIRIVKISDHWDTKKSKLFYLYDKSIPSIQSALSRIAENELSNRNINYNGDYISSDYSQKHRQLLTDETNHYNANLNEYNVDNIISGIDRSIVASLEVYIELIRPDINFDYFINKNKNYFINLIYLT